MEALTNIINYCTDIISKGGFLAGFFLVFIEAFIPVLPLGAFVTLNVNAFNFLPGVLLSWLATTLGSFIMYLLFFYASTAFAHKVLSKETQVKIENKIEHFQKIKLTSLVLLITIPFTPSCFINLLAGIAKISHKKYLISLLIGKSLMICFWAYIGKSFIESLTDFKAILSLVIMLLLAYLIAKIVLKKYKIE